MMLRFVFCTLSLLAIPIGSANSSELPRPIVEFTFDQGLDNTGTAGGAGDVTVYAESDAPVLAHGPWARCLDLSQSSRFGGTTADRDPAGAAIVYSNAEVDQLSEFTVTFWMKAPVGERGIASRIVTKSSSWEITYGDGLAAFYATESQGKRHYNPRRPPQDPRGRWTFVAMVVDSTNGKVNVVMGDRVDGLSALRDSRTLERGSALTRDVLNVLRDHGIRVTLLVVDFESGAYLRNIGDREKAVREQAAMTRKCPRCVETFTAETLSTLDGYATVVDESRAFAIRKILCEPAREIFPEIHVGNFYAWPINRLPRPEERWPAYGFEASGMNVSMPRVYMNAGWGGAGSDPDKMNWNAFHCCLEGFSPAASVLREGELLIPWVHVWLGGRYLSFVMRGRKLPEPWAMSEMACHMMLRGAETFAVWIDNPGEFPIDYPYPEYAGMGQFVYDVKGVQAGFDEMLQYNSFLRRARPMTFDVPGERNQLGPQTATWSGMAAEGRALVRTIAFNHGRSITKPVEIYGRQVDLTFGPKGRNHWVYPDGTVQAAD